MLRVGQVVPHVGALPGQRDPVEVAPLKDVGADGLGHVTALDAFTVVADDGRLGAVVFLPVCPPPPDPAVLLGVHGAAHPLDALLGAARHSSLPPYSLHSPEDAEHDVMSHHVKVPSYHRTTVRIFHQDFVHLSLVERERLIVLYEVGPRALVLLEL